MFSSTEELPRELFTPLPVPRFGMYESQIDGESL